VGFIKIYLLSFVVFMSIDCIWLGFIAKNLYREQIGFLMAAQFRIVPAILFYTIYLFGLVYFVIEPSLRSSSFSGLMIGGAIFGFVCYATYDLTNLSTLKDWPVKIVFIDLAWGTLLSVTTSAICYSIGTHWKNYFN